MRTWLLRAVLLVGAVLGCGQDTVVPTDAEAVYFGNKRVFEGFLESDVPDLDARMGIWHLRFVNRTSPVGANGWTDPLTLPTTAWYDAMAAGYTNPHDYILVDHESYPVSTQAERVAASLKYATIYTELKTRRPEWQIGFYAYPMNSDVFGAWDNDPDWQAKNEDFATLWAVADFIAPSLYFPYDRVTDDPALANAAGLYFSAMILEAQRCRTTFGHHTTTPQPIYPYVWYMRANNAKLLDSDVWDAMVRIAHTEADGMILWGNTGQPWNEFAPWWINYTAKFPWGDRTVLKPRAVRIVP